MRNRWRHHSAHFGGSTQPLAIREPRHDGALLLCALRSRPENPLMCVDVPRIGCGPLQGGELGGPFPHIGIGHDRVPAVDRFRLVTCQLHCY